jgi:ribonuclease HI
MRGIEDRKGQGGYGHWNCRGLRNKMREWQKWMGNTSPTAMVLNETGFPGETPIRMKNYVGYQVVGKGKWGTAIMIYHKCTHEVIYKSDGDDNMEVIMIQIGRRGEAKTLVGAYWPPNYNPTREEWRRILNKGKGPFIFLGDFNAHHEGLWGSNRTNQRGRVLAALLEEEDLRLHWEGETFFRPRVRASNLDLGMTSMAGGGEWERIIHEDPMGSDHLPWILRKKERVGGRILRRPNWKKFKSMVEQRLQGGRGEEESGENSVEEETEWVTHQIKRSMELAMMNVKESREGDPAYWSVGCQNRVNRNKAAWRRWRRSGRMEDYVAYRKIQAETKKFLQQTKRQSYDDFTKEVNKGGTTGGAWRILKGLEDPVYRPTVAEFKVMAGKSEDEARAEGEAFYSEIFTKCKDKEEEARVQEERGEIFPEAPESLGDPFSRKEFDWAVQQMADTAPGEDGISARMVKSMPEIGREKLRKVMNESWQGGEVPKKWKRGKIVLLPKPGRDWKDIKNWRPICLTSVMGKILERMVNRRMMWWLEESGFFLEEQHGFRWHRSTQDALAEFTGEIRQALQVGESVAAIHMDVEAAYTSVDTDILLDDLQRMRLPEKVVKWFQSYLHERVVVVELGGGVRTGEVKMTRGLMQGSVLSPTLWNIYGRFLLQGMMEDIEGGGMEIFADDVTVTGRHKRPEGAVKIAKKGGERLQRRCEMRGLAVRADKCQAVVHTQSRQVPKKVRLGDEEIKIGTQGKLLGVILDRRLTGAVHVTEVIKKCQKRLEWLRAVRGIVRGLSTKHLLCLYRGFIRSVVDYGAVALGHMAESQYKRLGRIETAGLRTCLAAFYGTANVSLYAEAYEVPTRLRWSGIRSKLAANRARKGRSDASGWVARRRGGHANRLVEAGEEDRLRSRMTRRWFPSRTGDRRAVVPFWEEEGLIQLGPCTNLPGKKADLSREQCYAAAMEALERLKSTDLVVYTDGSKSEQGTGAAFWAQERHQEHKVKLNEWNSVLTAELVAIGEAVEWAATQSVRNRRVVVITDSRSAQQVIMQGDHKSNSGQLRERIYKAAQQVVNGEGQVQIGWVPSHCGIRGNETADRLAGEAAREDGTAQHVRPSKPEIADEVNRCVRKTWQQRWETTTTGRFRREIGGQLQPLPRLRLSRKDDVLWHRLRLGVARLAQWRSRVLREESELCDECGREPETVRHVLEGCEGWDTERDEMWSELGYEAGDWRRNLKVLLAHEHKGGLKTLPRVRAIRRFLDKIGRREWFILV